MGADVSVTGRGGARRAVEGGGEGKGEGEEGGPTIEVELDVQRWDSVEDVAYSCSDTSDSHSDTDSDVDDSDADIDIDVDDWGAEDYDDDMATATHLAFLENLVCSLNERPNEAQLVTQERKRHEAKIHDIVTQMLLQGNLKQRLSQDGGGLTTLERLEQLIVIHEKMIGSIQSRVVQPLTNRVRAATTKESPLSRLPTERSVRRSLLQLAVTTLMTQAVTSPPKRTNKKPAPELTLAEMTRYSKLRRIVGAFKNMVDMEKEIRDQIIPSDQSQGMTSNRAALDGMLSGMEKDTNAIRSAWYRQMEECDLQGSTSQLLSTQAFEDEIDQLHVFIENMSIYLEGCMSTVHTEDVVTQTASAATFAMPPGGGAAGPGMRSVGGGGGGAHTRPTSQGASRGSTDLYAVKRVNTLLRTLPRRYESSRRAAGGRGGEASAGPGVHPELMAE